MTVQNELPQLKAQKKTLLKNWDRFAWMQISSDEYSDASKSFKVILVDKSNGDAR